MSKRRLLDCITLVGRTPRKFEGEKVYVSTGAVDRNHIDFDKTEQVTYEERPSRANLTVENGDVLFAKMYATVKTLRINSENEKFIYSTGFCAVRAKSEVLITECLYHLLTGEQFLRQKDANCSGATQKAITNAGLSNIFVEIPSLNEQRELAPVLDKIDYLISQHQQQLATLDDLVKLRFVEMFGDPMTNPMEIPSVQLKTVLTVDPQNGLYKPQSDYVTDGTGTPILRIDGFYNGKVTDFSNLKRLCCSNEDIERYKLIENDIVINRVNSLEYLGKCALIRGMKEETVFESNMMRLHIDEAVLNPVYITRLLCTDYIYQQILKCAKKAVNQASINQKDVQSFMIYVPPMPLQNQFADYVAAVDKSKSSIQKSLDELETLKKALMQEYFG